MYRKYIKRALDIVLSALGLVLLSPLFLVISAAIVLEDPGPVLFRQRRVGAHGSYFNIIKFRSMYMNTPHDVPTHLLEDPERWITRTGRVIRKASVDELPQIAQILAGKMSIIGPRPALWNQDDLLAEREKYGANDIRPGLTGLAQISGRDELEIPEKAKLDGEYAERLSFPLDVRIFFATISSVFKQRGVVEGGTGALRGERDK